MILFVDIYCDVHSVSYSSMQLRIHRDNQYSGPFLLQSQKFLPTVF